MGTRGMGQAQIAMWCDGTDKYVPWTILDNRSDL